MKWRGSEIVLIFLLIYFPFQMSCCFRCWDFVSRRRWIVLIFWLRVSSIYLFFWRNLLLCWDSLCFWGLFQGEGLFCHGDPICQGIRGRFIYLPLSASGIWGIRLLIFTCCISSIRACWLLGWDWRLRGTYFDPLTRFSRESYLDWEGWSSGELVSLLLRSSRVDQQAECWFTVHHLRVVEVLVEYFPFSAIILP